MTKEQIQEYIKCCGDTCYTIEKYLKTFDMTQKGFVQFKLFERQKDVVNQLSKFRHNLVTKPRQAGISTTTAAVIACKIAFADPQNPEKVLIIANKGELAQEFLKKIKDFLAQFPAWVWGDKYNQKQAEENQGHIKGKGSVKRIQFVNGCEIKAVATSADALRGYAPTYLIVDEAAYIENGRELYNAAMASLSTGGKMILISTPNGMDELYYKTYSGAIDGKNQFNIIELKWYEDPRYNKDLEWIKTTDGVEERIKETNFSDIQGFEVKIKEGYIPTSSWYREMCASMNHDKKAIARELDVKFEGSAGNVIDVEHIKYQEVNFVLDPKKITIQGYDIDIWSEPIEGHEYMMGVDISGGDGEDYSTIVLIDVTTFEQVGELKEKIRPENLSPIVYELGNLYCAYTVVDTTGGYGDSVVLDLERWNYRYLHYDGETDMLKVQENQMFQQKKRAGFKIGANRTSITSGLVGFIERYEFKIRSIKFTTELKTYVWINGRADHMRGYNDDIIMAAAIVLYVYKTAFKKLEAAKKVDELFMQVYLSNFNPKIAEKLNLTFNKKEKEEKKIDYFNPFLYYPM